MSYVFPSRSFADLAESLPEASRGAFLELLDRLLAASVRTDESRPVRLNVLFCPAGADEARALRDTSLEEELGIDPRSASPSYEWERAWDVIAFQRPVPADLPNLARASALVSLEAGALIIDERLQIAGAASRRVRATSESALLVSVPGPGRLAICRGSQVVARYDDFARVPERPSPLRGGPVERVLCAATQRLVDLLTRVASPLTVPDVMLRLAAVMAGGGHGGLIALAPGEPSDLAAAAYEVRDVMALTAAVEELAAAYLPAKDAALRLIASANTPGQEAARQHHEEIRQHVQTAHQQLNAALEQIGRLAMTDNALLLGRDFRVQASGYRVLWQRGLPPMPDEVRLARDVAGAEGDELQLSTLGSRHTAAASFAWRDEGNLAVLASASGPMYAVARHEGRIVFWPLELPPSIIQL